MITKNEFEFIKNTVFNTLEFTSEASFELIENENVYINKNKNQCLIGASDKLLCARALMLYAKNITDGKKEFEIAQKATFKTCGTMLDMSRGGVMTVPAIKKYLDVMACLGLNMFMLYTEDVYELEKYPYFGYMRGKYTIDELRAVDDYAYALGIEVIPCIQTLGHLEKYLRWSASADVRNTGGTLLCGEEATYEFIEEMIKTMRSAFRSNRIHIGMDEAVDANKGRYLEKHGMVDNFDLTAEHLDRVREICEKYNFRPMMWDDMFIKAKSKTGSYYDLDVEISKEEADKICDVDMVYWDYDRISTESTVQFINNHKKMGKPVILAGCAWTHGGQLPDSQYAYDTLTKQLPACIECGIDGVMTTAWGDNGCEINYFYTLPSLAILSEFCYDADNFTKEEYIKTAEFVTKWNYEAYEALSKYREPHTYGEDIIYCTTLGKALYYTDILYNLTGKIEFWKKPLYNEALEVLSETVKNESKWSTHYRYALSVFKILESKRQILADIRSEHENKNKEYFKNLRDNVLPALIEEFKINHKLMRELWESTNKPFGFEVLDFRVGGVIQRLIYARSVIDRFIEQDKPIEELEVEFIDNADVGYSVLNVGPVCSTYGGL